MFVPQGWKMELAGIADPVDKWRTAVEIARLADRLGLDSVWVYDPLPQRAGAAHETVFERMDHPRRDQPGHRARDARSDGDVHPVPPPGTHRQDHLQPRRDLGRSTHLQGVGASWYEHEFTGYGYDFPAAADRIRMLQGGRRDRHRHVGRADVLLRRAVLPPPGGPVRPETVATTPPPGPHRGGGGADDPSGGGQARRRVELRWHAPRSSRTRPRC
ncbi:MAG: hypothetical protein R2695_14870 [Acidimicrobiales bacterium]